MKIKNKGKVYPSPSSAFSPERDALSVLNLLPAAILALASLLSLEDREVLAYLITRSLKTTTNTPSATQDPKKRSSKKPTASSAAAGPHKPPVFECDCFDCYTSYWFRWDSSSNRELINQAIEAFEDHLANGEMTKKTARGKRRDKASRRVVPNEMPADVPVSALAPPEPPVPEVYSPEVEESFPVSDLSPSPPPGSSESYEDDAIKVEEESNDVIGELPEVVSAAEDAEKKLVMDVVKCSAPASSHKGLARKVLPDVLGLFNSRLWSLWNPNV